MHRVRSKSKQLPMNPRYVEGLRIDPNQNILASPGAMELEFDLNKNSLAW
jgi:hypothetical protein